MTMPFAANRTRVSIPTNQDAAHTTKATVTSKRLLTVDDVAERLGMCSKTVRRLIDRRELHDHKFGRLIRISEDDLANFIKMGRK